VPTAIGQQPAPVTVPVGAPATFGVEATGASLTYQWQRNGLDIPGATESIYTIPAVTTADLGAEFRVVVSGAGGTVTSAAAPLVITQNGAPTAVIVAPATTLLYKAGQAVKFRGAATDPQDGKLKASAFSWRVDFHHDDHLHPFLQDTPGKKGGSFRVPREGETSANVWYRVHLTVTDSSGLSTTTFRDVFPRTVNVTINASHPGLSVNLDGPPVLTPHTFEAVVGMRRTISADAAQVVDGVSYAFKNWNKSRKAEFVYTVPARDDALLVTYTPGAALP
jgi:hypothetical protein